MARFEPIDFDLFHHDTLPARLERSGNLFSAADAAVLRPLGFALEDGRSFTYVPVRNSFVIQPGIDAAHTVVRMAEDRWWAFVWEIRSTFALLYAGELSITRGTFAQLARWEPPLRHAFDGQATYDIDDPPLPLDSAGEPFDYARTFTLDDPHPMIAEFLGRVGFVHLRAVMTPEELEAIRTDVDAAVRASTPDDRRSWWTSVDGREVCNRVNYLNDHSSLIAGLGADDRFLHIATLAGGDLRIADDRLDGNAVVIKVPGSTGGLADLPWHRDCGMGGHPVKCPMINVGIQLDPATPGTGQLLMIPGSHLGTSRLPGPWEIEHLPVTPISTEPGDVTVHFGHVLHAAPAPTRPVGSGRRALYLSFVPPLIFEMVGPREGYNDVLYTRHDGRVQHVDQLQ